VFSSLAFLFSLNHPKNTKAAQWLQEEAEVPKVLAIKVSLRRSNPVDPISSNGSHPQWISS